MEDVSSLTAELKAHLPWHQARIVFLAQFILALLRSRSCNLHRIAENFQSKAQNEFGYRRIKRFFTGYTYCYEQLLPTIPVVHFSSVPDVRFNGSNFTACRRFSFF